MSDLIIAQDLQNLVDGWLEAERNGDRFPVPFDAAWIIAGYSMKHHAKRKLEKELIAGEDYFIKESIALTKSGESLLNGRSSDLILLTCDGFKHFCLLAKTEQGRQIRQYFIEAEKKWRLVQIHHAQVAEDVEIKRLGQMIEYEKLRYQNNKLTCDMATMHGKEFALVVIGRGDSVVEVEKPIIEVIDKRCGDKRRGMTDTQLNAYLKQKTGSCFKSGKACMEYLQKHAPELIDLIQRPVNQGFIHEDNIERAIAVLKRTEARQLRIGEQCDNETL